MENQGLPKAMVMGVVGLIFVVMFGSSMFVTINPGQKGVLFKTLGDGLDKDYVYGQGLHIIAPWNEMIVYDVKETETFEKMEVLSKNGLSIKIDLSILHMPVQDKIGYLHEQRGDASCLRVVDLFAHGWCLHTLSDWGRVTARAVAIIIRIGGSLVVYCVVMGQGLPR